MEALNGTPLAAGLKDSGVARRIDGLGGGGECCLTDNGVVLTPSVSAAVFVVLTTEAALNCVICFPKKYDCLAGGGAALVPVAATVESLFVGNPCVVGTAPNGFISFEAAPVGVVRIGLYGV